MEYFDLYDADRRPLGRTVQRGEPVPAGCYHIVVHLCLFDSAGRLLIQRRQPFKQGWPGLWDLTVGGSAVAGEDSAAAVVRETREELGLDLSGEELRPTLTAHFDCGFDDIYAVERDVDTADLRLQPEEVCDARWAGEEEILSMLRTGEFIPYRPALIRLLFEMKTGRGLHRPAEPSGGKR